MWAPPARAQVSPAAADSTALEKEGREAGRTAAGKEHISGRTVAGFFGGIPAGFLGGVSLAFIPTGVVALGLAASADCATPDIAAAQMARTRGAEFERAFVRAYERRLRSRRRRAAIGGAVAGATVGLGMVALLVASHPHT